MFAWPTGKSSKRHDIQKASKAPGTICSMSPGCAIPHEPRSCDRLPLVHVDLRLAEVATEVEAALLGLDRVAQVKLVNVHFLLERCGARLLRGEVADVELAVVVRLHAVVDRVRLHREVITVIPGQFVSQDDRGANRDEGRRVAQRIVRQ
jgi:hypothetical protein